MKLPTLNPLSLGVTAAGLTGFAAAHSWVEQMQQIGSDGSFQGPMGYPRGYVARTDPGFTGDSMNYLLPPLSSGRIRINDSDLLCHPSQRTSTQSSKYPMLNTSPGNYVAMKYLENGHVTLPNNQKGKPKSGGTVFVYGTSQPKDDEKLTDVLQWSQDGKGGDGRGQLLTAQNFDDGRCHQINGQTISEQRQQEFPDRIVDQPTSNVEQWCETDVQMPSTASGKMSVYWVWQWNTEAGADPTYPNGKDEYYTTCSDVNIGSGTNQGSNKAATNMNTLVQQDPQTEAAKDYRSRTALIISPLSTTTSSDGSSSTEQTTTQQASASATPTGGPASSDVRYITLTETVTVTSSPTSTTQMIDGTDAACTHQISSTISSTTTFSQTTSTRSTSAPATTLPKADSPTSTSSSAFSSSTSSAGVPSAMFAPSPSSIPSAISTTTSMESSSSTNAPSPVTTTATASLTETTTSQAMFSSMSLTYITLSSEVVAKATTAPSTLPSVAPAESTDGGYVKPDLNLNGTAEVARRIRARSARFRLSTGG